MECLSSLLSIAPLFRPFSCAPLVMDTLCYLLLGFRRHNLAMSFTTSTGLLECVLFPPNVVMMLQWVRGCELGAVRRGDSDIRCDSGAQGSV